MAKNDNLTDLLKDVADAIRAKKGTTEAINPQNFADEIASIEGGGTSSASMWTGHADVEGLKAIGWTDEDIAYYQKYGVNWNEEDDEYHKVTDDNKSLYGVLTISNISTYKDRIVYLPKIDMSSVTSLNSTFNGCAVLCGLPLIDTSNVTDMRYTFSACKVLTYLPPLNTSKVTNMGVAFQNCNSLKFVPPMDTSNVKNMTTLFNNCYSLTSIASINSSKAANIGSMFNGCTSLVSMPFLDLSSASSTVNTFNGCSSLVHAKIYGIKANCSLANSPLISKDTLLFAINNAATNAITLTLHSYAYERLANDADILEALANHPNISLAK